MNGNTNAFILVLRTYFLATTDTLVFFFKYKSDQGFDTECSTNKITHDNGCTLSASVLATYKLNQVIWRLLIQKAHLTL